MNGVNLRSLIPHPFHLFKACEVPFNPSKKRWYGGGGRSVNNFALRAIRSKPASSWTVK